MEVLTPPAAKHLQPLELAKAGVRPKRAARRRGLRSSTEQELDAALERWLLADA